MTIKILGQHDSPECNTDLFINWLEYYMILVYYNRLINN